MPSRIRAFESLLEAVPDAMVGVDQAGTIRFVNHQTEVLFAYERDDLVGQPVEMLLPESLRQLHTAHRKGYVTDLEPGQMGNRHTLIARHSDGTEFPVEISLREMICAISQQP